MAAPDIGAASEKIIGLGDYVSAVLEGIKV
jgi:hypothetical protein